MGENSVLKVKEMIKQFAENCKDYRNLEKEVAIAQKQLAVSKDEIRTLKREIYELVQKVEDLNPIDLDALNQEISTLSDEKSRLGFFALKRRVRINFLLRLKRDEVSKAVHKNELITEIEEQKKISETEKKKAEIIKNVIKTKGEAICRIAELIKNCTDFFLSMPEDALFDLVSESGADMMHLPNSVLKRAISKGVPGFLKDMPVQQQVKLLYPYDIPINFGGKEWNVLEIWSDKALLLLRGSYACPKYYKEKYVWEEKTCVGNAFDRRSARALTWKDSEAREILNNDFRNSLHLKEDEKILPGYDGDKFFCLSKTEVERYLEPNQRTVDSAWWLRDTDYYAGNKEYDLQPDLKIAYVGVFGTINYNPHNYEYTSIARAYSHDDMRFRPALWVELPYDSLDTEWNEKNIVINCKGKWTVKNSYKVPNYDIELTPDVVDRITKAASAAVNGPQQKNSNDDIMFLHRIDVSDM